MLASVVIAMALVAAVPDDDVLNVDQPELSAKERREQALDAFVHVTASGADALSLRQGEAVFVRAKVKLQKRPAEDTTVALGRVTAGNGLLVWPYLESSEIDGRTLRATYVIRAAPAARIGQTPVLVQLEVRNPTGIAVQSTTLTHQVSVQSAAATATDVGRAAKAYNLFQGKAADARRLLPRLQDKLRLDRIVGLPRQLQLKPEKQRIVQSFFDARVRAEIAKGRLRAAARLPSVSNDAIVALGALRSAPETARRARGLAERRTVAQNLAAGTRALSELRFDEAEAVLGVARMSGKASKKELADLLSALGALDTVRGRSDAANTHFVQSRCLTPEVAAAVDWPLVNDAMAASKNNPSCHTPTALGAVRALRRGTADGLVVDVSVMLGPDPEDLVTGGDIELWGAGGGVIEVQQIRVEKQARAKVLHARFADEGDLENFAGGLLVRVLAKDLSGVSVAALGVPDPVAVAIGEAEDEPGTGIPWWVWAAGGVVVAGAAAATAIVATSGPGDPVIGGISASF